MSNNHNELHNASTKTGTIVLLAPVCKPSSRAPQLLLNMGQQTVMPIRLVYMVTRPHKLAGAFRNKQEVTHKQGFYWFTTTVLSNPDNKLQDEQVIVVGRAKIDYKNHLMFLDSDSFLNAITLIEYLTNIIQPDVAKLNDIFTYNRFIFLHSSQSMQLIKYDNYDNLFSVDNLELFGQRGSYQSLEELEQQEKQTQLIDYPIIEKLAVCANSDGIEFITNLLQLRFAIAKAISKGITMSMWDFCATIAAHK